MTDNGLIDVSQILAQLGSAGAFAYLAYYLITSHIPARDQRHQESLERLADRFSETNRSQREQFSSSLDKLCTDQRETCERELANICSVYERSIARMCGGGETPGK